MSVLIPEVDIYIQIFYKIL